MSARPHEKGRKLQALAARAEHLDVYGRSATSEGGSEEGTEGMAL